MNATETFRYCVGFTENGGVSECETHFNDADWWKRLSIRARKCITRALDGTFWPVKTRSPDEVASLSASNLMDIKNCGVATVNEIKSALGRVGRRLRE